MKMPAISAPISLDRCRKSARPPSAAHQPIDTEMTISGDLAIEVKTRLRTKRLTTNPTAMRITVNSSALKIGPHAGLARLG